MRRVMTIGTMVLLLLVGTAGTVPAQSGRDTRKECLPYAQAVNADGVPREQLKDWQTALECLIDLVRAMQPTVVTVELAASRKDLLAAAKAMRVILDENTGPAIQLFRSKDDVDVISVLSYGARVPDVSDSPNRDLRLNTTLVLGNVIDNTTVCVPMDHLFDPQITVNGRANLLAVVSVVASWALSKNLENIEKVISYTENVIGTNNVSDTMRILASLKKKVDQRKDALRTDTTTPSKAEELLVSCRSYKRNWAGDRMQY